MANTLLLPIIFLIFGVMILWIIIVCRPTVMIKRKDRYGSGWFPRRCSYIGDSIAGPVWGPGCSSMGVIVIKAARALIES